MATDEFSRARHLSGKTETLEEKVRSRQEFIAKPYPPSAYVQSPLSPYDNQFYRNPFMVS